MRLQLEGLKSYTQSFDEVRKVKNKKKKRLDPDHPDFDSEEEYGNESDDNPDERSDSEEEGKDYYLDDGQDKDDEDDDDMIDEEGEEEMVSMDGAEQDEEPVKKPRKEVELKAKPNKVDEQLAKREATLIAILSKSFRHRVIIFSNHKAQCTRLAVLLTSYGLKVAEVHSNIT